MDNKRSFTVVSVGTKNTPSKGAANLGGRYLSSTPAGAARKVGSHVCRKSAIRGQCTLFVKVQETTRGSAGKTFTYKVKRVVVNNKVDHEGTKVLHKYATLAKAVKTA